MKVASHHEPTWNKRLAKAPSQKRNGNQRSGHSGVLSCRVCVHRTLLSAIPSIRACATRHSFRRKSNESRFTSPVFIGERKIANAPFEEDQAWKFALACSRQLKRRDPITYSIKVHQACSLE
jgi:hypothetical protein